MEDPEIVLSRFKLLMQDLLAGHWERTCFEPWEVDLLLDIDGCTLDRHHWRGILQRYRKAAERRLDSGLLPPLKLSEYLKRHPGQPT